MGHPISRRKLAAELAMSSVPVSEALLRLEYDGLLESRPRAGTRVRIPNREDVEGHYVVREALEAKAAMLFAECATREERTELIRLAIRVDNVFQQTEGNRSVYLNLHEKLHRRIAECARCQSLTDALIRATGLASIWECGVKRDGPGGATHENLTKVLVAADPGTAAQAVRDHIRLEKEVSLRSLTSRLDLQKGPRAYSRISVGRA
jgi:DNA-binding GntR family transcriptional regulator